MRHTVSRKSDKSCAKEMVHGCCCSTAPPPAKERERRERERERNRGQVDEGRAVKELEEGVEGLDVLEVVARELFESCRKMSLSSWNEVLEAWAR